jgi:ParB family chromosome partitioning protein
MLKKNNTDKSKPSKKERSSLGRGIGALFPDIDILDHNNTQPSKTFFPCNISKIIPNKYQPRTNFSEKELDQLKDSIKKQGIIQPLIVRKSDSKYELICGERRLRAAKLANIETVPVILSDITDNKMLEFSIIENIHRENLNPMEEAKAYEKLISEFNLTQVQIAEQIGKSRSSIANFLRLNNLPENIKKSIHDNLISMGHARALLGANSVEKQNRAWLIILKKDLSVRETEKLIKRLNYEQEKTVPDKNILFTDIAKNLSKHLKTKVFIKKKGSKGKVEIEFHNDDDLHRLISLLKPQKPTEKI